MEDAYSADAVIRQWWAEGLDMRAVFLSDGTVSPDQLAAALRDRAARPLREGFQYPGPDQVRIGAPLMAVFVEPAFLVPWVERLCGGALQGIGRAQVEDGHMDRIAHWRLNLALGRGFPRPEHVVQRWAEQPDLVQDTPAEQQVLRWYRNHEPWLARWHPYREGGGAMRRAPIWGAIYRVPQQAAVAAAGDARTAYGGWGIWAAAVVAHAISGLPQDWTPDDATQRILHAMTAIDPDWPGIADLRTLLKTTYPASSWDAWRHVIDTEFAGYPLGHSLPNLLLILGVLHWHPASDPEDLGAVLQAAGWDVLGNRLVAGAFLGRSSRASIDPVALHRLVEAVVSAHGHPPHI